MEGIKKIILGSVITYADTFFNSFCVGLGVATAFKYVLNL